MKTIMILSLMVITTGCSFMGTKDDPVPREVFKPVWTVPAFDMPVRPVLRSTGSGSDGITVRDAEFDMLDVIQYSTKLENLIKSLTEKPLE